MKGYGNGRPEQCAANLLRIIRGEIPYDRVRGRDPTLIDKPNAAAEAAADMEWLINTYEPRVDIKGNETLQDAMLTGDFSTLFNIQRKEEEEEWQNFNS